MSSTAEPGLIGPNAILQMLPVIERLGGKGRVKEMLDHAGIFAIPDGSSMIPEQDAARLHRQVRLEEPKKAPLLTAEAGKLTADYILAHRIPQKAQTVLKMLPAPLAALALSKAIAKHAWTFAGSGRFRVVDPWTFEIAENPIIRGERSDVCLCDWHAAVFQRLYAVLVHPDSRCSEVQCGAQDGSDICRFKIER